MTHTEEKLVSDNGNMKQYVYEYIYILSYKPGGISALFQFILILEQELSVRV